MKNIIHPFAFKVAVSFALLLGVFVSSCDKEKLDPKPLNFFSDLAVFSDPSRILLQVNGLYAAMKTGTFLGGRYYVYNDIRGEEFLNETTNVVTGLQTWNFTQTENENNTNTLWNAAYYAINSCNIFIEGLQANRGVLNNETLANNYLGEARFLRAVAYYCLLQLYARPFTADNGASLGVPLRIKAQKGAGDNDLARSTVAEVYAQILGDLNFAEQNLPANYATAVLNVSRAHRNTAIAFKTRVYLTMGRYADVITEANKIVPNDAPFKAASGVAHELQANVTAAFGQATTTENILSMPFADNNAPGTQNGLGFYYNPGPRGGGEYSLNPQGILGNAAFAASDARRTAWVFRNTANNKDYLNKFPGGPPHLDSAPVMRYAEVLLSLAEAIARTSGVNDRAIALLNAVRGRSNPSGVYTAADFANADALIQAILTERRIELIGEGLRSIDIMRLGQTFPAKGSVPAVPPSANNYIWPIPSGELAVNKLCVPNP